MKWEVDTNNDYVTKGCIRIGTKKGQGIYGNWDGIENTSSFVIG
jgi:hypothetical protein